MIKNKIRCKNVDELQSIAADTIAMFPNEKLFFLSGKMGVGKTTFIRAFCQELGVIDVVNSPTFSIINEYKTASGDSVYHFDLYRIKKSSEILDIGYEEYLYSDNICLVEWPELAMDLLPSSYVLINIELDEETGDRIFELSLHTGLQQNN
jgi:tRNA threonylcarbamoyladenosine biosynthesis protein TsaE